MGECEDGEGVEWMVLDFTDAFWQIRLHPDERKYFCCRIRIRGKLKFIAFLSTAQGSRGAPLTWARLAALIMRLTQSLFDRRSVRLQCFVDDPIGAIKGSETRRKVIIATITLVWEALGCKLAYSKGQRGNAAEWIGGELDIQMGDGVLIAKVKKSIIADISLMLEQFHASNVISLKDLESFIGKVNHAAGLLVTIRPFLQSFWAALYGPEGKVTGTIWTKQVAHSLSWLRALFYKDMPGLVRKFYLADFQGHGEHIEIGSDASPWGLGAWLAINHVIVNYFYCGIDDFDVVLYNLVLGACEGQQTLECLAILVALRAWIPSTEHRVQLSPVVRGDNLAALSLVLKMRPRTDHMAIIGREIALHLVHYSFLPAVYHTPGVSHVIADSLSRVYDPSKPEAIEILHHPALSTACRTEVPVRTPSYYRALENFNPQSK